MKTSNRIKNGLLGVVLGTAMATNASAASQQTTPSNQPTLNKAAYQQYLQSKKQSSLEPSTWVDPAWRSALVPGWGQHYNGDKTKAVVLGGLTWGLFAAGWTTYFMAENAGKEYEGMKQGDFDAAYSNWENTANLNHGLVAAFGVAYAWNLIDAITSAKSNVKDRVQITPNGVRVALLDTKF